MMDDQTVKYILHTFGADSARWPKDLRDDVTAAIAKSDALQALRDAEAGLDKTLDQYDISSEMPADLNDKILAAAPFSQSKLSQASNDNAPVPWMRIAATLLISLGIGFGSTLLTSGAGLDDDEALFEAATWSSDMDTSVWEQNL